jgi:ABC-type sulfate transport system permease subunit
VQAAFEDFNLAGAYSAAFVLALMGLVAVVAMRLLKRRELA